MFVAHWTDVATGIIHVLEEMAVAFNGQLYGIGKHLVVIEERILQFDTDGCVFLDGERLAVGKKCEFAIHILNVYVYC